ncbi:MAG: hypothetical protein WC789_03810 [Lentisphaeria bacterium]
MKLGRWRCPLFLGAGLLVAFLAGCKRPQTPVEKLDAALAAAQQAAEKAAKKSGIPAPELPLPSSPPAEEGAAAAVPEPR